MKKYEWLSFLFVLGFILSPFAQSDQSPIDVRDGVQTLSGNKMLIFTTPKYAKDMDEYIDWKIARGLDVEVDIQSAQNGADTIQQKIREKYDRGGLTYIVLVGDIDDVPSVMLAGYPSDPSYTLLQGDDLIGDALISRISVNTLAELVNQLNKIVKYEKGDFANFDWIRHHPWSCMQHEELLDREWRLPGGSIHEGRDR